MSFRWVVSECWFAGRGARVKKTEGSGGEGSEESGGHRCGGDLSGEEIPFGLDDVGKRVDPGERLHPGRPVVERQQHPERIMSGNSTVWCTVQNIQSCSRTAIAKA